MAKKGVSYFTKKEYFVEYRIQYLVVTEGETEENYFAMVNKLKADTIEIICKKAKHPSVRYLISTMEDAIKRRNTNKHTRCWLVLDQDTLTPQDIHDLQAWSNSLAATPHKYIGVSAPEFEYWLLLHFEIPATQLSATVCTKHLKRHIPRYKKPFQNCYVLADKIETACENAVQKEISLGDRKNGTNLHHLVKKVI
ncbi:MAG: RloB family protein [Candidatus Cloacimonetes bacterium]|nr:RloB family protein [Candidatus Cloacimonadota bacterium]